MQIDKLMSQPVHVCNQNSTLNDAAQLMWECDCGAIPIVDDEHRLVGMLTDRDICMAAYTKGEPLSNIRIADVIERQVLSCRPDQSIETAEHLMSQHKVRRIPVIDAEERPIAMLSLNDIVRSATNDRSKRGNGLGRQVIETLAAISEPDQLDESVLQRAERRA